MTILFAVLSSILSFIGSVLKAIPPIVWLCIVCVIIGMLLTSKGCSCRRSGILAQRQQRITRKIENTTYAVSNVINGAAIEVKTGLRERRSKILTLKGINCPAEGQDFYEQSKNNLKIACGSFIRIKTNSDEIYGESGICLQTDQLSKGLAKCNLDSPEEWKEIENKAKKQKLGLWSKENDRLHWFWTNRCRNRLANRLRN